MDFNNQGPARRPLSHKLGRVYLWLSIFLAFLIIFLSLESIALKKTANSPTVKNKTVFIASGNPEWAPMMYKESQAIVGIGADLTTKIFADLKLPLENKYIGSWEEVQAQAERGEVDVLVGTYKSATQLEYLGYTSIPYYSAPLTLFTRAGQKFSYRNFNSLVGKKGVVVSGVGYGPELNEYIKTGKLNLTTATSSRAALYLVSENKADYFIYYQGAGEKALASNLPLSRKISVYDEPIASEDFYIAISKNSPYYSQLAEVSKALYAEKQAAYIDSLVNKYQAILKPKDALQ